MLNRSSRPRPARRLAVGALAVAIAVTPLAAGAAAEPDWVVSTVAGNGEPTFAGDGGPATEASLFQPRDTALAPDGSIVVVDTFNNRVRRIAPDGTISTVAGTGVQGFSGDGGPAADAQVAWPHDVVVDTDGTIYFADSNNNRIRRIDLDGVITTIAGTGTGGMRGDGGPAVDAELRNPKSVVLFGGELFTAGLDDKVRAIDLDTGIIRTVAGTGVPGFSGDGGPAELAQLDSPQRIQIDSTGVIYVADTQNSAIRRIGTDGIITTIAGTGAVAGNSGDGGPGTDALLDSPRGVALDGDDLLYIADSNNHRVRVLDLATGVLDAVAGTERGEGGDGGPAGEAAFTQPRGLTVMPDGDVLVADTFNNRLRLISNPAPIAPSAALAVDCVELVCAVDGSGSSDDRGVVSWAWEFSDGGVASGPVATHSFATAGTYTVSLTVTDAHGLTSSATTSVAVTDAGDGDGLPVAAFTATCSGLECTFDAAASNDPDGTLVGWAWSFGDGVDGRRKSTQYTYAAPGSYAVTLTVTDDEGFTASSTQRVAVSVVDPGVNVQPIAGFSFICSGTDCTFDAGSSSDPDGSIVDYTWDLGDGAGGSAGPVVEHRYAGSGSYLVTLTVTDDRGASSSVTEQVDAF